jgi:hypothetical protein
LRIAPEATLGAPRVDLVRHGARVVTASVAILRAPSTRVVTGGQNPVEERARYGCRRRAAWTQDVSIFSRWISSYSSS